MGHLRSTVSLLIAVSFVAGAEGAVTIVEDGYFADADWELVSYSFRSTGGAYPGGYVSAGHRGSGWSGSSVVAENCYHGCYEGIGG